MSRKEKAFFLQVTYCPKKIGNNEEKQGTTTFKSTFISDLRVSKSEKPIILSNVSSKTNVHSYQTSARLVHQVSQRTFDSQNNLGWKGALEVT